MKQVTRDLFCCVVVGVASQSVSIYTLVLLGILRRSYVDNFFSGPYGSETTIGILHYLFTSTTLFDKYSNITFSSDSGSGFRQSETLYYYSSLKSRGKIINVQFLPPGHAFNMADSHGGHLSDVVCGTKMAHTGLLSLGSGTE